jgi:hypothetical protein
VTKTDRWSKMMGCCRQESNAIDVCLRIFCAFWNVDGKRFIVGGTPTMGCGSSLWMNAKELGLDSAFVGVLHQQSSLPLNIPEATEPSGHQCREKFHEGESFGDTCHQILLVKNTNKGGRMQSTFV